MRTIWFFIAHALEVTIWIAAISAVIGLASIPFEDFIIYQTLVAGALIATLITPYSAVLSFLGYTLCVGTAAIAVGLWFADPQFTLEQFSITTSIAGYQYFGLIVLRGLYEPMIEKICGDQKLKNIKGVNRYHLLAWIAVRVIGAGFFILGAAIVPTPASYVWLLILTIPIQLYLDYQLRRKL